MSSTSKARAIVISSYIRLLIQHLDNQDKIKSSTIRLRDTIMKKILKESTRYSIVANNSWNEIFNDKEFSNAKLSISTVIETLYFNYEKELTLYYGKEFSNLVVRFLSKMPTANEATKSSYSFSDKLKELTDKNVYNFLKEEKC